MTAKNRNTPVHHRPRNAPAGPPTKRVLHMDGRGRRRIVDANEI